MKYLGIARTRRGQMMMPDAFQAKDGEEFDAVEVGGDILLLPTSQTEDRLEHIRKLARQSISKHRKTMEKLAG